MATLPDIDLEISKSGKKSLSELMSDCLPASVLRERDGTLVQHGKGYYRFDGSVAAVGGLCAVPYAEAEELGMFKMDLTTQGVCDFVGSSERLRDMLAYIEDGRFDWDCLLNPERYDGSKRKIYQLSNHMELMMEIRPDSIERLAMACALVRPNKGQLREAAMAGERIGEEIWIVEGGSDLKKPHALSLAMMICCEALQVEGTEIPEIGKPFIPQGTSIWEGLEDALGNGRAQEGGELADRIIEEADEAIRRGWESNIEWAWGILKRVHGNGNAISLGKGSSSASALLYALGFHEIDPVRYGASMEWFFKPEEKIKEKRKFFVNAKDYVIDSTAPGKIYWKKDKFLKELASGREPWAGGECFAYDEEIMEEAVASLGNPLDRVSEWKAHESEPYGRRKA